MFRHPPPPLGGDRPQQHVRRKEQDLQTFSSLDGIEWDTFREHFQTVHAINQWDPYTAKLKLKEAMMKEAARATAHVYWSPSTTVKQALDYISSCTPPQWNWHRRTLRRLVGRVGKPSWRSTSGSGSYFEEDTRTRTWIMMLKLTLLMFRL